jgi:hypothetical protein
MNAVLLLVDERSAAASVFRLQRVCHPLLSFHDSRTFSHVTHRLSRLRRYYAVLLLVSFAYSVFAANMFVSQMAFFARVSDPAIGGTYMTLPTPLPTSVASSQTRS